MVYEPPELRCDAPVLNKHTSFNTLNLHRIWLQVYANNQRAIRTYEKVGFVHEGRKREAEIKQGQYVDLLLMSILNHEYRQQKEG